MPDPVIRHVRERDFGRTAAMLARAFAEAPLTQMLAPDPNARDRASRWLFGSHLRYASRWGQSWAAVGLGRSDAFALEPGPDGGLQAAQDVLRGGGRRVQSRLELRQGIGAARVGFEGLLELLDRNRDLTQH